MQDNRVGTKVSAASQQFASINTGCPERSAKGAGWYILRCGGGTEFLAAKALRDAGWATFLPVERKWRVTLWRRRQIEAEYPRFPRYLFLYREPPDWPRFDEWPLDRYVRGVLAMNGEPVPLAPGEIDRIMAEDGTPVLPAASVPLHRAFQAGDQVRVRSGGWRDWVVRIDAIDESGAHITVPLFGRQAAQVLPLTWLEAA
jgi:transcription antitermination factor NusG